MTEFLGMGGYAFYVWGSFGATVVRPGGPAMPGSMLWPLLSMALGFTTFLGYALLLRVQNELLWRERGNPWVKEAIG